MTKPDHPATRRRFTRLELPGNVVALDDDGNQLGQVNEVSGGGAQLTLLPQTPPGRFLPGVRLHITVVEGKDITDRVWVEVRYIDGRKVGLKFLG